MGVLGGVGTLDAEAAVAEVAEVDATGHMVAGSDNDEFSAAMLDFVRRV